MIVRLCSEVTEEEKEEKEEEVEAGMDRQSGDALIL